MTTLNRKLFRELAKMRGQVIAITLVVACGIMAFVSMRLTYLSLVQSQDTYYTRYRFADVFANLKRAPASVADRIAQIPGVSSVRTRIVMNVNLDVPGLNEPATGRLVSIPVPRRAVLNDLSLQEGRYPRIGKPEEVIISEVFAKANDLVLGDWIGAVINGRRKELRVVGIGLSPEYVYEVQGTGSIFPDNRRFGIIWMGREALAGAFDMEGGFNDLSIALSPNARERDVIDRMDHVLEPYGSAGAYGRDSQISHRFLSDEIAGLSVSSTIMPAIFLGVAALLLHIVFSRMVRAQREQIAILKAYGYANAVIGWHYLKFAFLAVSGGTLLGIAGGIWLGRPLTGLYQEFYRFPELTYVLNVETIAFASIISVSAALLGTLHALQSAMSMPPAEAMRPDSPAHFRPHALERMGVHRMVPPVWRMIFRNMERRPVKTLLSAAGIAMAVAILVMGRFGFDSIDYMIDFQFRTVQREDASVVFAGPLPARARFDLAHLPGVIRSEPYRAVPVRLRSEHRMKQTAITGLDPAGELRQLVDQSGRILSLPPDGVVLTKTLADLLDVREGDMLTVEVLEGSRHTGQVPVTRLVDELIGVSAYMDIRALNRFLGEGPTISGAFLSVDPLRSDELYSTLKQTPAVAGVAVREAVIKGFEDTIAESTNASTVTLIVFSCIIACGMVYNGARIALSERNREMASLRVIGFTEREISVVLLGEQAIITLLAIPIGFLIGWVLCYLIVDAFAQELYRMPMVITGKTYAFSFLIVSAAAALSSYAVHRRLRHLDLIGVLKTIE